MSKTNKQKTHMCSSTEQGILVLLSDRLGFDLLHPRKDNKVDMATCKSWAITLTPDPVGSPCRR